MSQPPPRDQGQSSDQGEPPKQAQPSSWASGKQLPSWPSGNQPPAWPSGGSGQAQPPAWPSGKPDQGEPPSWPSGDQSPPWPPGGQPPYPGPGYGYGYGPRPPRFRRRRRHPFRGAIIALVLFVIFGFVVRNITNSHNAVSITQFPSASGSLATGRPAPPGTIGSHFDLADGSGNVYRMTLVKVIDPANGADHFSAPDDGKRLVGVIFRVKALAGSPQNEDANNDAVVIGGNGQTYSADFDEIAGYANFKDGAIRVAQGETVTGSVTFQVPNGVTVSRIQWTGLSGFGSTVEWKATG
jgi:hypothetical protein